MQYFLPSKTSTGLKRTSHGIWTPPNISFLPIIRMQQSRSRRQPRSAAFRPCPQAFRRQQPFETRKRAIFHGLGEHGPRAACKYSRARAHSTPSGRLNWHKDGEAAVDRSAGSESARRGEIVNTLPLTYISRRDGTTAGYQPRKHQATE